MTSCRCINLHDNGTRQSSTSQGGGTSLVCSSQGPESYPGSSLHCHTLPYSFTSTKYARGKYILTCFLCICLNTCTGRCTPRPISCSLTSASTVSHQVVACVTTVDGCLSKSCSSSVTNLAVGWISQTAAVNCQDEEYVKPSLKQSCIPCINFSPVFKFTNLVHFQSFAKMYHQNFFRRDKQFSCSDHKTVNEKDPVVSIGLLTVTNSSEQQCMFGLYATPYSTWHVNAAISQNYFNEMFKNCYLPKNYTVEILHLII